MDSSVPLMHHDPDRSWITNPHPDHPKGTHSYGSQHVVIVTVKPLLSGYPQGNGRWPVNRRWCTLNIFYL